MVLTINGQRKVPTVRAERGPYHKTVNESGQLRQAGLVDAEKDGREVRYRVQANDVIALLRHLADSLESCETNCCVEE